MSGEFEPEQKRYLEGFVAGLQIAKAARSSGTPGSSPSSPNLPPDNGPDADASRAQDKVLRAGKKLSDQEKFKRELNPLDAYGRLKAQATADEFPKPPDNFRWRYFGLFYVAPNQNSYMCRLRIHNGILTHWQFAGIADLTERCGGPYAHVTTRANLQIREIAAKDAVTVVEGVQDLGLSSRGSGADNIRNVTGTPTAGIDPQELIDTRPYAREWHFHILSERALYGLPRKFNVAFDGAGLIPVLEDTNDIAFQAVEVKDGFGVAPGVWFRFLLGGITGHRDFARETGVVVRPSDATQVADAVVRVFINEGDRTDRNKARLKYVIDRLGIEQVLTLVEEKLGRKLDRITADALLPRPAFDRTAHIGVHAQKQEGLHWIGVVLPVGRMTVEQMRGLAAISHELGDGDIRLTVWQNLLISGVPTDKIADVEVADRGARSIDRSQFGPRRPRGVHRQRRLQVRRVGHQAPRRGDCSLLREPRHARWPGQHSPHRLPSFLCAALHRRHRPSGLQGADLRGRRHGRGLPHPRRRRLRPGRCARARNLP